MIEAESLVPVLLLLLIADCFMVWQVICFNRKRLSGVQVITARFPILALIAGAEQILQVTTIPMIRVTWEKKVIFLANGEQRLTVFWLVLLLQSSFVEYICLSLNIACKNNTLKRVEFIQTKTANPLSPLRENLLFWRDASQYRKAPSLKKAFLIYRNYIIPFAIRQVNLPAKITFKIDDEMRTLCSKDPRFQARYNQLHRSNTRHAGTLQLETVKSDTPSISKGSRNLTLSKNSDDDVSNIEFDEHAELREVFAEAQISIFQLLEEGPWIRFLVSEQYEQWINEQAV